MSSIQERLQLKRVPLDTWNIKEQLCLASAVVRSGDQNWMSVSRALKTVGEPNRPPDWYSQKSCAAQYGVLLEHVETPKRKKRSSEGAGETPQESIVKRLTQDRIAEIQKSITEMNQQYEQLQNEITEVRNPVTSEERLREIWSNIEATKRAQERENARRAALLKEREERRARAARSPRTIPNEPPSPSASVAPPASPLLTSLLKSSPVVTTPQHIPHPATIVDTISPSVTAPTLSMLLEKSSPQQDSKRERAAIEHIKSQLVQIEQQLKANTPPPPPPPAPLPLPAAVAPAPSALDIDDIEINAEDVYVFRDVDIHIPTVQAHAVDKGVEKPAAVKEEAGDVETVSDTVAPAPGQAGHSETQQICAQKEPEVIEEIKEELPVDVENVVNDNVEEITEVLEEVLEEVVEEPPAAKVEDVKIAFPEVKFPTTEIKVIQPDEQKIKEESKECESVEETKQEVEVETEIAQEPEEPAVDSVEQQMSEMHAESASPPRARSPPPRARSPPARPPSAPIDTGDIPLPPEPHHTEPQPPPEPEMVPVEPEPTPEVIEEIPEPEVLPETRAVEELPQDDKATEELKKDEDAEDSIPLKQMLREESLRGREGPEDAHTETDDDTPMELSREEEKDGKKKRDYSRKKKADSRTCSGSESAAEASAPESPHASDAEREHRLWKKSVMLVYSRLCAHKYASLFLRPITDDEAPGYSVVVRRPMDLSTIRRNIESGHVRTTAEFQRDVLLMLCNALMYNSSEHSVYTMAREMHDEASSQLGMLLAAQAHAALQEEPPARRKRRHALEPRHALAKRHH